MNNHYFTDNRHLPENRKEFSFRFWYITLKLISDNGVFSKHNVDYGSRVLLDALHKHDQKLGDTLLDVGCGYGVIGLSLKKAYPDKQVTMLDINPRAVELTKLNAQNNQCEVAVHVSDAYDKVMDQSFTDIITNPPIRAGKKVIYPIFAKAYEHLLKQGNLWVVIRKAQGAESAKKYIESIFGNCEVIQKDKGYYILRATKA
ncbi:class I SAM-dependent methyltransferase [bacterium c-19]|nr:class I SAM-dependent methyltransferase [bacterium c-19]